jgi:hypothetical protein
MKKTIIFAIMLSSLAVVAEAGRTRGYTKKNGTYVAPSYRSKSDSTKINNYSTKGNTNPYSGKRGTRRAY